MLNEKITDMAKEAGLPMCGCGCNAPTRQQMKFAELILQETIVVMNMSNGVGDDDVIQMTLDVKRHFNMRLSEADKQWSR